MYISTDGFINKISDHPLAGSKLQEDICHETNWLPNVALYLINWIKLN